MIPGQPLPLAQLVAVFRGNVPGEADHETARIRPIPVHEVRGKRVPGVRPLKPLPLCEIDLLGGNGELAGYDHVARAFHGDNTIRFIGRRSHMKFHRPFDHDEGLPLPVDEPPAFTPVSGFDQEGIHLLELVLLSSLAQRPFRRAVNACVGIVPIKAKSLSRKWESEAPAELCRPEIPARREARPPESNPSGTDSKF